VDDQSSRDNVDGPSVSLLLSENVGPSVLLIKELERKFEIALFTENTRME
jgi:hypothetical protein